MPVLVNQLSVVNAGLSGYDVAKVLSMAAIQQFAAVRGTGVGIGPASCCASFAVVPAEQFPPLPGQPFGATFGNSRVAAGGLDQGPVGGHAERCALTAAGNNHLAPFAQDAVLFVELAPCNGCMAWLIGDGGGVPNPYDFGPNSNWTLQVWFAFPYPGGVTNMADFHELPLGNQLHIAAQW